MTAPSGRHARIYRSLLRLYPNEYRASYSEPMVQLFTDQLRDEGAGRTWARALGDVPTTAFQEHLRRNRTVAYSMAIAPSPGSRLLGLLGVLGGGVLLIGFLPLFIPDPFRSADLFNLRLVLFNAGAIAIAIAVYIRQRDAGRRLALAGSVPAVIANAAYMLFTLKLIAQPGELGPGDYQPIALFNLTAAAMWLGDAWLGLVTFRLGVLNRISALALLVGSIAAFAGMGVFGLVPTGSLADKVILTGVALHGVAWILLGLEVALRGRRVPVAPA